VDKFDVSILEYLGQVEGGILVLISITHNNIYYEGTFFYNDKDILLTVDDRLEQVLEKPIKEHSQYQQILKNILGRIVPYNEMISRTDPVDFSRWVKGVIEIQNDESHLIGESIPTVPTTFSGDDKEDKE
jgi:hypothetical protein